ncbi:hypothetical protein [Kitasatospora sp. CB01950]|uniref:hypothetical protein n=1 Tax=Kitasatospora sp. CB01950 TaxID=1703930 RepID=UPI00093BE1F9|nr:hypothetical protein [Kitasatospora sp. CB01950]
MVVADDAVGAREALAALGLAAGRRAALDAAEARLIETACAAGGSWNAIGAALGMTKQSAAERYQRLRQAKPDATF